MMSENKGVDLSGLDDFNVSSLITGKLERPKEDGLLSYAPIDKFVEDKNNARKHYDPKALEELVNSIKVVSERTGNMTGVKQPLSVRKHPERDGFFIINGGSRRYRAGIIAGLKALPYFISDSDSFDNVVDNLIRDGLKTEEVAFFISERIKAGDKQVHIANRLGKPKSYVSDYGLFYDLPDSIRRLFDHGFCDSMQGLALLARNHKKYKEEIDIFCNGAEKLISIKIIRDFIEHLKDSHPTKTLLDKEDKEDANTDSIKKISDKIEADKTPPEISTKEAVKKGETGHDLSKKEKRDLVLLIDYEGEPGRLIFKNTLEYGKVIIKTRQGETKEVHASQIKVLGIEED